jgi:hypothetical protein
MINDEMMGETCEAKVNDVVVVLDIPSRAIVAMALARVSFLAVGHFSYGTGTWSVNESLFPYMEESTRPLR